MELMRKGAEGGRAGLVSKKKGWGLEELRWAGGWGRGRHQMQREYAAAAATDRAATERALKVRKGQSAKRQRKRFEKCGRYVVRSGQKRSREVNR